MSFHERDERGAARSEEPEQRVAGMSRRAFALGVGGAAAALALGAAVKVAPANAVVRPPGGQDEELMLGACIRCEKCYEACPRGVIKPAHIEDGILGMRMPQMCFDADYCNFCEEENNGVPLCVATCPTGALSLAADAEAESTLIGLAELNKDWCLAYNLQGCRFCYDACPYEAMELDEVGRPYVIDEKCNGCGACEAACVSLQAGSIAASADERAIVIRPIEG